MGDRCMPGESLAGMGLVARTALVTGAASGIGLAAARGLAAAGAKVILADRDEPAAAEAAKAVGGLSLALDIGNDNRVFNAIDRAEAEAGPLDVLVNAAALPVRELPTTELPVGEWDLVHRILLRGTYLVSAAAGMRMAERRSGSVVIIAAVDPISGPGAHLRKTARDALVNLTECLAAEWGGAGVRVNCVTAGPGVAGFNHDAEDAVDTAAAETIARTAALGRTVTLEEVAAAITFLASDRASGLTGVTLPVDAGYRLDTQWFRPAGVVLPRAPTGRTGRAAGGD